MLTIVAAMAWGRPVFLSPPDKREEAKIARKQLAAESAGEEGHQPADDLIRLWQYLRQHHLPDCSNPHN